jgi:formylglycine-generating enzyme required for sulfatase activity
MGKKGQKLGTSLPVTRDFFKLLKDLKVDDIEQRTEFTPHRLRGWLSDQRKKYTETGYLAAKLSLNLFQPTCIKLGLSALLHLDFARLQLSSTPHTDAVRDLWESDRQTGKLDRERVYQHLPDDWAEFCRTQLDHDAEETPQEAHSVVPGDDSQPILPLADSDRILHAYCAQRRREWKDFAYNNFYIEPHYSTTDEMPEDMQTRCVRPPEERKKDSYRPVDRSGGPIHELTHLLDHAKEKKRLCLTEDGGTGKSFFTRRLLDYFGTEVAWKEFFGGNPCLAMRWEGGDAKCPLPTSVEQYRATLKDAVTTTLKAADASSDTKLNASARAVDLAVETAIKAGRLVVIVDAVDQAGLRDENTDEVTPAAIALSQFLADVEDESGQPCWVILTGRTYAAKPHQLTAVSDPDEWRYARIDGFDEEQQFDYLAHPAKPLLDPIAADEREAAKKESKRAVERAADALILDEDLRQDVLEDPVKRDWFWKSWKDDPILKMIGVDKSGTMEDLCIREMESLFPNYDEVAELVRLPVILRMVRDKISNGSRKSFQTRTELYLQTSHALIRRANSKDVQHVETILAAVAFEMATSGQEYLSNEMGYVVHGEEAVGAIQKNARRRCDVKNNDEWDRLWKAARETVLADRALMERFDHAILGFRHKSIQEFYCGLHLAKNVEEDWPKEVEKLDLHAWQWHWPLRFAIEMTATFRDKDRLMQSLAPLFQPPGERSGVNELIYRAWSLIEAVWPQDLPRYVTQFQAGFYQLIKDGNAIARQLVPEKCLPELIELTPEEQAEIDARPDHELNYVRCPPEKLGIDRKPSWMGAAYWPWEGPRHQVRVAPFFLQSTTVTREQYALYDASLADQAAEYSPESNCPIVRVTWYEAWCFAHWVGARLPTECEWEFACRAGKDDENDHFSIRDRAHTERLHTDEANFNPTWEEDRFRAKAEMEYREKTLPVRDLLANDWHLYQMHGNVWEWCEDWFDPDWYKKRTKDADETALKISTFLADKPTAVGSLRVLRGGGWLDDAGSCRSAYRYRNTPVSRSFDVGFRLLYEI